MTEQEWLLVRTPEALVGGIAALPKRKQRLWATAAVGRVVAHWDGFEHFYRDALDANERFADDAAGRGAVLALRRRVAAERQELESWHPDEFPLHYAWNCRALWLALDPDDLDPAAIYVHVRDAEHAIFRRPNWDAQDRAQFALMQDIFANPFRPASFAPEWRTDTAVALARQMYDARDFSLMPILGDALEDAGCDNPDILDHCRDTTQVHVRGCWVVDLVLGLS